MLLALFGVVENWLYILIFNLGEKMQRLKIIELSDGGAAEIAVRLVLNLHWTVAGFSFVPIPVPSTPVSLSVLPSWAIGS